MTIPFLILLVLLAACGRDGHTLDDHVSATQQRDVVCPVAPTSTCQAIDEFTPVLDPATPATWGWRDFIKEYFPPGVSTTNLDITVALKQAVQDIALLTPSPDPPLNNALPLNGVYRPTLYIRHGSYLLTSTVEVALGSGITIVGEDPATTTITWNGPSATAIAPTFVPAVPNSHPDYWNDNNASADMFHIFDAARLKLSRLTLNGNSAARIGVQVFQTWCYSPTFVPTRASCGLAALPSGAPTPAVTALEFNDDIFENMSYGLVANENTFVGNNVLLRLDAGLGTVDAGVPIYGGLPVVAGTNVGDVLVRRSTFKNIAQHGVNTNGSNVYNWLIADSAFTNCFQGVQVSGSGGISVINSRFYGNGQTETPIYSLISGNPAKGTDLQLGGDVPEVVRGNYSLGSRKFVIISMGGALGAEDISGNYVVTSPPAGTAEAIITSTLSQLTLFDNYFESATPGVVAVETSTPGRSWSDGPRIAHGGNSFNLASFNASFPNHCTAGCATVSGQPVGATVPCEFIQPSDYHNAAYGGWASEISLGDTCAVSPSISAAAQKANSFLCTQIPATPPVSSNRLVVNVSSSMCSKDNYIGSAPGSCSDAINYWLAHTTNPGGIELFFPGAGFYLGKTIEVPGGLDVVIAGEGAKTVLYWSGADAARPDDYVFHLAAPSRATLRDFGVSVPLTTTQSAVPPLTAPTTRAGGILVESHDDAGGLVFADTLSAGFAKSGIDILGLDNVAVRADMSGGGSLERMVGVTGGGKASPSSVAPLGDSAQTKGLLMFAGGGGSQSSFIELKNWGKAVLVGTDNEQMYNGMVLDQSGYLSLANGRFLPKKQLAVYTSRFADQPNSVIRSTFRGRITLMGLTALRGGIAATAATRGAAILSLDNWFDTSPAYDANGVLVSSPLEPSFPSCPQLASGTVDCSYEMAMAALSSPPTQMELQDGTACGGGGKQGVLRI